MKKFRAWDKKNNKWIDHFSLDSSGTHICDGEGFTYEIGKDVEVVQYIGLKDKFGREIYEGEILGYFVPDKVLPEIATKQIKKTGHIIWNEKYFRWCLQSGEYFLNIENMNRDTEIIGHIFVNPNY